MTLKELYKEATEKRHRAAQGLSREISELVGRFKDELPFQPGDRVRYRQYEGELVQVDVYNYPRFMVDLVLRDYGGGQLRDGVVKGVQPQEVEVLKNVEP